MGPKLIEETNITNEVTGGIHMNEKYDRYNYKHTVLDRGTGMVAEMDAEAWWNIYIEKFIRYVEAAEQSADAACGAVAALEVAKWVGSLERFSDNDAEDYAIGKLLVHVLDWMREVPLPNDILMDVYSEMLDLDIDVDSDDY